ncbi:MAG: choice-of-anchor D domain-containing protein [Terriglobales bacterium]
MNGSRLYRHLANFLVIASGLLLLTLSASGKDIMRGRLAANPSPVAFGNTQAGATESLAVALSNYGETDVTITRVTMSGAGFSMGSFALPLTLQAGTATSATITFAPPGSGSFSGSVSFDTVAEDQVTNKVVLSLGGYGINADVLNPNPSSLAFGSVQVGNSANLSETLTNSGGSTITISQANLTGSGFSTSGLTLPLTLTANQSVTFTATFTPASAGAASGTLSVVSNASNSPLNIALSGTGTAAGQLAVSPASLSFGNVDVGSSSSLNGNLNASGAAVTITAASLNNAEFVLSGISLPATLGAGQSTSFTVTFTPQATGATSASLAFSSNAANSPAVQTMTGTGTSATQHTVDLSWNGSDNAVGYNVYRGTVSGGPYSMINPSLDGTTTYTDNTVVSGQTYYYVATAVDSESQESGYSNETQAVIPNP